MAAGCLFFTCGLRLIRDKTAADSDSQLIPDEEAVYYVARDPRYYIHLKCVQKVARLHSHTLS